MKLSKRATPTTSQWERFNIAVRTIQRLVENGGNVQSYMAMLYINLDYDEYQEFIEYAVRCLPAGMLSKVRFYS